MKIIDKFPDIYASILPDFFHNTINDEALATCANCYKCPKSGEALEPDKKYFSPDVKCCTFYPEIPNYLVGAILSDDNPAYDEGRSRIEERISKHIGVTPHGLLRPLEYNERYIKNDSGFGTDKTLLCPYFNSEEKKCSIWVIRPPICSTWFCVYIGYDHGDEFWRANRNYLLHAENIFVYHILHQLNFDPMSTLAYSFKTYNHAPIPQPNNKSEGSDLQEYSQEIYDSLWGKWVGRERELYVETFRIFNSLTKSDFEFLTDIQLTVLLAHIKKMYEIVLSPEYQRVVKYHAMSLGNHD